MQVPFFHWSVGRGMVRCWISEPRQRFGPAEPVYERARIGRGGAGDGVGSGIGVGRCVLWMVDCPIAENIGKFEVSGCVIAGVVLIAVENAPLVAFGK